MGRIEECWGGFSKEGCLNSEEDVSRKLGAQEPGTRLKMRGRKARPTEMAQPIQNRWGSGCDGHEFENILWIPRTPSICESGQPRAHFTVVNILGCDSPGLNYRTCETCVLSSCKAGRQQQKMQGQNLVFHVLRKTLAK